MSYVRDAWYVVAWSKDLARERPFAISVMNEPIVVWRSQSGALAAFEDRCIHRLAPLSLGRCEGERLRCMYHGFLYDRAGHVIDIPGENRIPSKMRLRTYPVTERHGWVWIWMGASDAADEGLIPPVIGTDDPEYVLGTGQLDYAAGARLVNENLLDLSHVRFLHAGSIPMSAMWPQEAPEFTRNERSVRTEWWLRNTLCGGSGESPGTRCDFYSCSDFYVPGILIVKDKLFAVGAANSPGPTDADLARPFTVVNHAVTPLSDRRTRYFYSTGPHRDYGDGMERKRDILLEIAERAFAEDRAMIEGQQGIIDSLPRRRFNPTSNDRGVLLFNEIVEKLTDAQTTQ
jgi:phenylpropionate dioxygenase-like ring-hydroxylating dioxygenase large terminal subunit